MLFGDTGEVVVLDGGVAGGTADAGDDGGAHEVAVTVLGTHDGLVGAGEVDRQAIDVFVDDSALARVDVPTPQRRRSDRPPVPGAGDRELVGNEDVLSAAEDRARAAEALAAGERADRAWRREMALPRAAAYPDRFPTVEDAVNAIPDPVGGRGAQLAGDEQDIADAARRADPAHPWHVIRGLPDATVAGVSMGPDGRVHTADTRAPWQRGD